MRIVVDPGHGGSDTGAVYKQYREKDFNLKVSLLVRDHLLKSYEAEILMTRTTDKTMALKERTDFANNKKADFFCSIHHNAAGGRGFESYIFNGTVPDSTKQIQTVVHKEFMFAAKKYGVNDRGQKRANFFVLRNTRMNALLLEVLFVDNEHDLKLILNDQFVRDVSKAIAIGIAKALNLKEKPAPAPDPATLYKVIAGSFKEEENAKDRAQFLLNNKIEAYIYPITIDGTKFYRVQAGAFSEKKNAEGRVAALKRIGIQDAFIVTEGKSDPEEPSQPDPIKGFTIQGSSVLVASNLQAFVKRINPNAPNLASLYIEIGKKYGLRGDAAYAQAVHETNYFRYTGVVKPEQNNYAGIGATGPDEPGASFATPREGVAAHIQHLYAYASKAGLPDGETLVDPRFNLVARGSAPTWVALNGKWAVPGTNYGQLILGIYDKMLDYEVSKLNEQLDLLEKTKQQLD
ncbi:N-acetylmuramoyl-L-alanine amidase [Bacillus sp. Marseille-Q3570]|uniref:N-acetylmuramoyl-L-alanine amidase n=1 Tax=Bacillus sp. Marseille-Q3570 TaxID=2963522 RepID=UPI0021B7FD34|nr:N-acetylmuramoyl-L-alanine amidase [Bacillus sp. Marseille-Q3570]